MMESLSTSRVEETTIVSRILRMSDWRLFVAIFCLAFGIRLALLVVKPDYRQHFQPEEVRLAISIAEHGQFADPFGLPTGPSAASPPVYPFLLSFFIRLFGSGVGGALSIALFTCILSSLQYASMIFLSRGLGIPRVVCILAAFWGAVTPFQLESEMRGRFENTLSACALLGLTLLTAAWLQKKSGGFRRNVLIGVAWGVAIQISTSLLPIFAVWVVYGLFWKYRTEGNVMPYLRGTATAVVAILVLLVPWTVRNYISLGSPIWSRDNFGGDLHMAYDDCAEPTMLENMRSGCFYSRHPTGNFDEATRARQLGEVEYNRQRLTEAETWIKSHPARFANLTFFHYVRFWFVDFDRNDMPRLTGSLMVYFWALTILSFVGLAIVLRTGHPAGWLLGTGMVAYSLIYCLHQALARYRYPIYWMTELLAVYAIVWLSQTFWKRRVPAQDLMLREWRVAGR
ncbi:MAG TPA: hypothetical protein VGL82_08570 [Bryobacteraceae bacterium]|jgi:hypothetical protein